MATTMMKSDNFHIDFNTLSNITNFIPVYHGKEDTFFLRPDKPRPATSFDLNGEIWLRVDPENGEVVGLEIDDFEAIFLKKHPELAKAWAEVKPWCHRRKPKEYIESFLLIILNFLLAFLRDNPQQISLEVVPAV